MLTKLQRQPKNPTNFVNTLIQKSEQYFFLAHSIFMRFVYWKIKRHY